MAKKVYVYTKNNCVQCKFVKKFLEKANIEFSEVNIDNNLADMEFVKAQGFAKANPCNRGNIRNCRQPRNGHTKNAFRMLQKIGGHLFFDRRQGIKNAAHPDFYVGHLKSPPKN